MSRGINDYVETYAQAGSLYCSCGHMYHAAKYHWRGEKNLHCSVTCLMIEALKEENQDVQSA